MKPLTLEHFTTWRTAYGRASAENDPQASADYFAENAHYPVLHGRELCADSQLQPVITRVERETLLA